MLQNSSKFVFFFIIAFGLFIMDFFTFPYLWDISFSGQMISGSSSDHMIFLAVRRRSQRELDGWSFGGGLF